MESISKKIMQCFLIILIVSSYTGYAQDFQVLQTLQGSWQFDYGASFARIENSTKTRLNNMPQKKLKVEALDLTAVMYNCLPMVVNL